MQSPKEPAALSEMEELLQMVQNLTQTRVTSFHRIPAYIYAMMFRTFFVDNDFRIEGLVDVVRIINSELQQYNPPEITYSAEVGLTFAHHIQILSWLKDLSARLNVRYNVVPDDQLVELKIDENDPISYTPVKKEARISVEPSGPLDKLKISLKSSIQAKKERIMVLNTHIESLKSKFTEPSGMKRRVELRKLLSTLQL